MSMSGSHRSTSTPTTTTCAARSPGTRASWSLAVFDEAHRLTPTSQYLGAARQLADRAHHLLLLTATPHRGKEHFFRALLNLLDPVLYEWSDRQKAELEPLRPAPANFIRRMKEELRDLEGRPLFPGRTAVTEAVDLTLAEEAAYQAVMDYVDEWYPAEALLARSIYGKRAASSLVAARATLGRRHAILRGAQSGRVPSVAPDGFERDDLAGADVDSDEAWEAAEKSVVEARTRDRVARARGRRGGHRAGRALDRRPARSVEVVEDRGNPAAARDRAGPGRRAGPRLHRVHGHRALAGRRVHGPRVLDARARG